ncbi:hypothetical protein SCLCIDRAFT_1142191, partial [Scleroderma citrinum Foug A]
SPTINLKVKRFKISLLTSEAHLLTLSHHSTSMLHYRVLEAGTKYDCFEILMTSC